MNKQELQARRDALAAELESLDKAIVEAGKVWPQQEESFFYIDAHATVRDVPYIGAYFDKAQFSIGNAFRTREEAEAHVEYLKVCAELRGTEGRVIRQPEAMGYGIAVGSRKDSVPTVCSAVKNLFFTFNVWWSTAEHASAALAKVGAERIKAACLHEMQLGMQK